MSDHTVTRLPDLIHRAYHDDEELTTTEFQLRAAKFELSPPLRRLVGALPDGRYDRQRAGETLERIQREEGMWRDESRTSAADLSAAVATYAGDGQVDDATGNEAGPAQRFGEQTPPEQAEAEPDPDTPAGRRVRPSPEGRIGPY